MMEPKRVRTGDWDISYTCRGSGPPLLLLHGGSPGASGHSNFHANVAALARHFTTYVIDFPGWGGSSKNLLPPGIWGNAVEAGGQAALGFLDAVGIEKANFMGSSFGGAAALHVAMVAPDRVGRVVLLAPGGGIAATGSSGPALGKLFGYYAGEGPTRQKFESLARHLVHDPALVTPEWLEQRFAASLDKAVMANPPLRLPPGYVPDASKALSNDPRLERLAAPVLFIWGRNDQVQPVSCLESFKAIPNQDAVILGDCGHLPHWEQATKVNDLASWFLQQN